MQLAPTPGEVTKGEKVRISSWDHSIDNVFKRGIGILKDPVMQIPVAVMYLSYI